MLESTFRGKEKGENRVKKKLVLSLFSGIGAFERALENIGIEYSLVGYSEIDKFASKSYSLLHGISEDKNLGDITKIDEENLPKDIDLLTYGFPCQDISIAGRMEGLFNSVGEKTRSGLFFDALRIINAVKPKIAIAENVKNLTNKSMKSVFDTVLNSLEEAGYNNYWKILNCADYKIPQNRERVLIVSIRKNLDDGRFAFPKPVLLDTRLADFLEEKVDESYFLSEERTKNIVLSGQNAIGQVANLNHYRNDQMNRVYGIDGLCPTLKTVSGGGREIKILDDGRCRYLTPKEYFRLMGFTDGDVELLKQNKISKTQLYKMAGNSIPVKMLEHLFRTIYEERK
jgi:DNA (cytosine-5)-methyltransferase 1